MCGLAVTLLAPRERTRWELDRIWDIFTENLIQNEERGKDATGVGIVQQDGARKVWKLPIPASEFVNHSDYCERIRGVFGPETICLLGHTRKPTKGSVGHSNNNHPILTEHVIGIHNGKIPNDDRLFGDFSMPRNGEVDSEVIFAMLETIPEKLKGRTYCKAVAARVALLRGQLTTVSADVRRPGELLVLKRDMPFSMHYEESFGALFFSSRYVFLRKAFGRSVITEALVSKLGYIFKTEEFSYIKRRYSVAFAL